jgi:hypothetical protein
MARVGRLAGALLVETRGDFFLVGNTKEPCDWAAHGFEAPPKIDATERPWLRLEQVAEASVAGPHLVLELEGEALAQELARRMLIERNGSVSDRLWRLALGVDDEDDVPSEGFSARWLVEVPEPVWRVVRDAVLRCL